MSIVLRDLCFYPGLIITESASYTCQHGISPGIISAVTQVPPTYGAATGTFTFSDETRKLELKDCKLERNEAVYSTSNVYYNVTLLDRRWRWAYGQISGHYNRLDARGNLMKRYVRRPKELAELCLKAMGEKDWEIDLPEGVGQEDLKDNDNPAPGEITPPTSSNPEVVWDNEIPAHALARLCDEFGRRLIWCPVRDKVIIARPGDGAALPVNEFLDTANENIKAPERPDGIGVVGAHLRIQGHWKLEAVGIEWDGRILPIDELSYRPKRKPQKGEWKLKITPPNPLVPGTYTISGTIDGNPVNGAASSASGALDALNGAINGLEELDGRMSSSASGDSLTMTGERIGDAIDMDFQFTGPPGAKFEKSTVKIPYMSSWDGEVAGVFAGVQSTNRLSYDKARELAIRSVWRMYRLANESVESGWEYGRKSTKIKVPGYGEIDSRMNLILQPTMVEQLKPQKLESGLVQTSLSPVEIEYYDGYSRDRAAVCYGQISKWIGSRWSYKDGARENTDLGSRVLLEPEIDPTNWLVKFPQCVYRVQKHLGDTLTTQFARLTLETAVLVRDRTTMGTIRYRRWFAVDPRSTTTEKEQKVIDLTKYQIPIPTPFVIDLPKTVDNVSKEPIGNEPPKRIEWHHHDDVSFGGIGKYERKEESYKLTKFSPSADDVSEERGDYYLLGHYLEHQITGGVSASYHGVQLIPLDGAIMQLTITVGSGVMTRASRNCEHGVFTLPYPRRRLAENLDADPDRANANRLSDPALRERMTAAFRGRLPS